VNAGADVRTLAGAVVAQGEQLQQITGELSGLAVALMALVRTHPDPERFAAEFRRLWLQHGSQHSNAELGGPALESISAVLEMLEEACPVPLGVRPPQG